VDKNNEIYRVNSIANFNFLIKKGSVKTLIVDEYGKEFITSVARKGSLLGVYSFQTNSKYIESAFSLEPTKLIRISRTTFNQILKENQVLLQEIAQLLFKNVIALKN